MNLACVGTLYCFAVAVRLLPLLLPPCCCSFRFGVSCHAAAMLQVSASAPSFQRLHPDNPTLQSGRCRQLDVSALVLRGCWRVRVCTVCAAVRQWHHGKRPCCGHAMSSHPTGSASIELRHRAGLAQPCLFCLHWWPFAGIRWLALHLHDDKQPVTFLLLSCRMS